MSLIVREYGTLIGADEARVLQIYIMLPVSPIWQVDQMIN